MRQQIARQRVEMQREASGQAYATQQQRKADFVVTTTTLKNGVTIFSGVGEITEELALERSAGMLSNPVRAARNDSSRGAKGSRLVWGIL